MLATDPRIRKNIVEFRHVRGQNIMTHLVEVLEQVDYPTLNLGLVQAGGSGVEASTLSDEAGSELRAHDGGAADLEGSRGPDDTGGRGSQGADDGRTEHCGKDLESATAGDLVEKGRKREVVVGKRRSRDG